MVVGPRDKLRLQHTSRGVVYITQSHLDILFFPFWRMFQNPQKVGVSLEISMRLYSTLLGGVKTDLSFDVLPFKMF